MHWTNWITLIVAAIGMVAAIIAALVSSRTQHKVAVYSAAQDLALKDHEIKLSSLHRERVTVIIKIFHDLLDLELSMQHYLLRLNQTSNSEEKERAYVDVFKRLTSVNGYFYRHKFYFEKTMCVKIAKVFGALNNIEQGVYGFQYSSITSYDLDYSKEERTSMGIAIDKAHKQMRDDLKIALHDLQDEIRHLIGVQTSALPLS